MPYTVISTGVPEGTKWRNLDANDRQLPFLDWSFEQIRDDNKIQIIYYNIMSGSKTYYVYIMANQSRILYIGVTNNIERRVHQHKTGLVEGFTNRYKIDTLVYVESFADINSAIAREKQLKRWGRKKKLQLILRENPDWWDLSDGWYDNFRS